MTANFGFFYPMGKKLTTRLPEKARANSSGVPRIGRHLSPAAIQEISR